MKKKFHVNHAENFVNFMKTWILTYCAHFQGKKQPENMDPRVHDLHTHESSSDIHVLSKFPGHTVKTFEKIHNFFEFETWLHPLSQYMYVAVGFLFAQLERLWNGLHTAIGTDHELFHSLNIYNTNLNFELFGGPKMAHKFYPLGPSFYTLTIVAPLNF